MSNEELASSLRTEIQTYLKNTVADLQQEIAGMQERVSAEIERHRGELEKSFQDLLSKGSAASVDDNFAHVISEHLQMAYEDGSKEAGEAIATASPESGHESLDYRATRDAINEISFQNSQADILKSLVKHASGFAPRGAFFIVKSEHLVGWRVFGSEITGGDESVREVFLSVNSNTVLGESIRQNSVQHAGRGEYAEDAHYLQKLAFGEPQQMIAIPLVVRGRGVAVLYADAGEKGSIVQVEALESLVRVAGLTVELLASRSSTAKPHAAPQPMSKPAPAFEPQSKEFSFASPQPAAAFAPSIQPSESAKTNSYDDKNGDSSESHAVETTHETFDVPSNDFAYDTSPSVNRQNEPAVTAADSAGESYPDQNFGKSNEGFSGGLSTPPTQSANETEFSFETTMPSYTAPLNVAPQQVESQTEAQQQQVPRRFSERNTELPIDVPEDERRLHNDARRFARLLVSEIKLYNEQKVKEGRQAGDLYNRLREAIERSREMYDKRVAPPVASRFDYFHYELVNTLAEGNEEKLGDSYPGATI
ncbi:MAG: hypothetical protein ABI954_11605 [Pyrinomonadaceae bacterium]